MVEEIASQLLDQIARELSSADVVFPTAFDLTLRVQAALKDPEVTIDRMTDLIRAEPLLSTKIITYANSAALHGAGKDIQDLHTAILRVGLEMVRSVSYSVAIRQLTRSKQLLPFQGISNHLWTHSLAVAAVARQLARKTRLDPEKAFYLGVVHDIGAFYLLFRCAVDEVLTSDPDQLLELLFDWHDGIGHALLSAMGHPDELLTAVQDHEAAAVISKLSTWTDLLEAADVLGRQIEDWLPDTLRARHPRSIDLALLSTGEQAEILNQAREELSSLQAALL